MSDKYFEPHYMDGIAAEWLPSMHGDDSWDGDTAWGRPHGVELIERVWQSYSRARYVLGKEYLAEWPESEIGFRIIKVNSPSVYLDRCVIENPTHPEIYAMFNLYTQFQPWRTDGKTLSCYVHSIMEYHLSPSDEALLRLSI